MAVKVNPITETFWANRGSRVAAQAEVISKAKIQASVIPPRRKLVKRMMFDLLVQFVASLCSSGGA